MAKKLVSKNTKNHKAKSGVVTIKKSDRKGVIQKGIKRKSAADGFSMEIPPKKPVKTKPKNNNEKKE